jgi:hypothetical protein
MPKTNIDYSNTIIYKICCKDSNVLDIYVGHTTNFRQRKSQHKLACNKLDNTCKIYDVINQNGGWDYWDMVELAKYNCKDATEARIKEQQHYEMLNASLNCYPPYLDKSMYYCDSCKIQCQDKSHYNKHILTDKHLNILNKCDEDKITNLKYFCEVCNFKCCKKGDWTRHIKTDKHIKKQESLNNEIFYNCECGNEYKSKSGLWKHKKICFNSEEKNHTEEKHIDSDINCIGVDDIIINKNIITELFKQYTELKLMVLEQNNKIMELMNKNNI